MLQTLLSIQKVFRLYIVRNVFESFNVDDEFSKYFVLILATLDDKGIPDFSSFPVYVLKNFCFFLDQVEVSNV